MADLIIALVVVVGGGSAAELVRSACRRQLTAPLTRTARTPVRQ